MTSSIRCNPWRHRSDVNDDVIVLLWMMTSSLISKQWHCHSPMEFLFPAPVIWVAELNDLTGILRTKKTFFPACVCGSRAWYTTLCPIGIECCFRLQIWKGTEFSLRRAMEKYSPLISEKSTCRNAQAAPCCDVFNQNLFVYNIYICWLWWAFCDDCVVTICMKLRSFVRQHIYTVLALVLF